MNEILQNYIFHYSPYRGTWAAFTRDNYLDYFNGKYDNVTFAVEIQELVTYIVHNQDWKSFAKSS